MSKFSIGGKNKDVVTTEDNFINDSKTAHNETKVESDSKSNGRGNYKRISFNLPPQLLKEMRNYSLELKDSGEKDSGLSTIVSRACIQYLSQNGVAIDETIIVDKIVRD